MIKTHSTTQRVSRMHDQRGVGLLEALVAMVIFAIIALSLQASFASSIAIAKITEAHHAASSIAASRVESLVAVDPMNITPAYNETEVEVPWADLNLTFLRSTFIVVNGDNSRTVRVVVDSNSNKIPATVDFTTTLALWE